MTPYTVHDIVEFRACIFSSSTLHVYAMPVSDGKWMVKATATVMTANGISNLVWEKKAYSGRFEALQIGLTAANDYLQHKTFDRQGDLFEAMFVKAEAAKPKKATEARKKKWGKGNR